MSKKLQKPATKASVALHTDDWDSRFWIDKIPEYKPKSAAGNIDSRLRRAPALLPKIQSASNITEISPVKLETEAASNYLDTEMTMKTEQISEIKNPQSSLLYKRRSKFIQTPKSTHPVQHKSPANVANRSKPSEKYLKPGENRRTMQKKSEGQVNNFTSKSAEPGPSRVTLPKISHSALGSLKTEGKDPHPARPGRSNGVPVFNAVTGLETLNSQANPDEIRETSSESEESLGEELSCLAGELAGAYLNAGIMKILQDLGKEAVDEALLAYLTLSASKILYSYIKEALDEMIPGIAKAAYNESKEKEPSELRDEIAEEVGEIELRRVVQQLNVDIIANAIAGDYMQLLPLEGYVIECIQETEKSNKKKILKIFHFLIDSIVEEEWVEVLAEDVINSIRIERNWNLLPPNLQKEVGITQKGKILDTLSERVYFDLLNDVVAGVWVESLVLSVVKEDGDETVDVLMPIPKFSIKKQNK